MSRVQTAQPNSKMLSTISVVLLLLIYSCRAVDLNTKPFPDGFLFGVASSAYQVEGAWNESGKGESIWDYLTHNQPDFVADSSNGDVACDAYHRTEEDVGLIADLGVDFYRFSIAWTRILPTGFYPGVNEDGLRYYNELIDALLDKGVEPLVTIYHWDLPRSIQTMGGWTNEAVVDYFEDYARVLFENFGDRVKKWITINEPINICYHGYGTAEKAPAISSSGIGDYLCMHNVLKAHARAYHVYDTEFRPTQKGNISITLDCAWVEPASDDEADIAAANVVMQITAGWMANPIFGSGDYPEILKAIVGNRSISMGLSQSRLPEFTPEEIDYIKGTADYFGLNHYSSGMAAEVNSTVAIFYDPSWATAQSTWLKVVPWGFRNVLNWIKQSYNASVFVTENGYSDAGETEDVDRVVYFQLYLSNLLDAIYEDGVDVLGYTFWSAMDNFEWAEGYQSRFGLYRVDFDDPALPRTAKSSVEQVKQILADRQLPSATYNSTSPALKWSAVTCTLLCTTHLFLY